MKVDDLIDAGNLPDAVVLLSELIRKEPVNFRHRTYLFALLCFAGDYQRAGHQLTVMAEESDITRLAAGYYEKLLRATMERERVFREGRVPRFLTDPPAYADLYVQALQAWAAGDQERSADLLRAGEARRPRHPAIVHNKPLADFRDVDDRLGPFIELLLDDAYVWVPLEQIRSIQLGKLTSLRDLFWSPVRVVTMSGVLAGVMPALYPASFDSTEPRARLGQMTVWPDNPQGLALGAGQRLFTDGSEDFAALELQQVDLTVGERAGVSSGEGVFQDEASA